MVIIGGGLGGWVVQWLIVNMELSSWLVDNVGLSSGFLGGCREVSLLAERCKTLTWGVRPRVWEWRPSLCKLW
jgi:hypothetical protein